MPKRKKKPARKPRKRGLREPSGRLRRSAPKADYGTPELLQRRTAAAMELGINRHTEALSHPLDVLWRQGHLTEAQHAAGMRYGMLCRLCNGGPRASVKRPVNDISDEDLERQHTAYRAMQQRVLSTAGADLNGLTKLCGLMQWPEWMLVRKLTRKHAADRRRVFKALEVI